MAAFPRFDIDKPLWDQSTFSGRLKHFFWVTDPRTCIVSEETLDAAKQLVEQYRWSFKMLYSPILWIEVVGLIFCPTTSTYPQYGFAVLLLWDSIQHESRLHEIHIYSIDCPFIMIFHLPYQCPWKKKLCKNKQETLWRATNEMCHIV